ncbi:MAG TPA: hypothetical protein QGF58_03415 [Myxococcota bacterium]|nr:hypothetical protein [Myxococcota bacterium]
MIWICAAFAREPVEALRPVEEPPDVGLDFVGLAQVKTSGTNVATTNAFLDGQVIGVIDGDSGADAGDSLSHFSEQRVAAFLGYRPPLLDGHAALHGGFEIDFAFGDAAYGIGGNTGGGFGGDQVNLQTRRLYVEVDSQLLRHEQDWRVGLHFVSDGVGLPEEGLDAIFRSGARGTVFASEAAGASLHGQLPERLRYRLGVYKLVENASSQPDDVTLGMGDVELQPGWRTRVGLHAWYLRDRSDGQGGALGVGPSSSTSALQGGPSLDVDGDVDVTWLGADAGWNADLRRGDLGAHGVALAHLGSLGDVDAQGFSANGEARWRWTAGKGSVLRAEVLYATGDSVSDVGYTGVLTGNTWGIAGANHTTHGTLLLHPDLFSINRQVSHTGDLAASGRGQLSFTGSLGYDPVPDRLTVQFGGGHASYGGGTSAQEINLRVLGEPYLFMRTGLSGAYLARPGTDAWIVYASFDWLVI